MFFDMFGIRILQSLENFKMTLNINLLAKKNHTKHKELSVYGHGNMNYKWQSPKKNVVCFTWLFELFDSSMHCQSSHYMLYTGWLYDFRDTLIYILGS